MATGTATEGPQVPAALYAIPIMANPGVQEKPAAPKVPGQEKGPWYGNLATFREYRANGGLIGFAPDPRTGHECGDSRYLAIPFFDARHGSNRHLHGEIKEPGPIDARIIRDAAQDFAAVGSRGLNQQRDAGQLPACTCVPLGHGLRVCAIQL